MGCATTTVKFSSIIFNVILAILGVGAIGWISFNTDALNETYAIAAYIACSLVVVFAFLGCFAAIRESVCLTATCAVFLLILAILQIITTFIDLNERKVRSALTTVDRAWEQNEMDELQSKYECCGKTSAHDYILLNRPIPVSCYDNLDSTDASKLFIDGCVAKIQDYFDYETVRFTIVSWVLVAFELLGFLLAIFLVINFRNTQRRMHF